MAHIIIPSLLVCTCPYTGSCTWVHVYVCFVCVQWQYMPNSYRDSYAYSSCFDTCGVFLFIAHDITFHAHLYTTLSMHIHAHKYDLSYCKRMCFVYLYKNRLHSIYIYGSTFSLLLTQQCSAARLFLIKQRALMVGEKLLLAFLREK